MSSSVSLGLGSSSSPNNNSYLRLEDIIQITSLNNQLKLATSAASSSNTRPQANSPNKLTKPKLKQCQGFKTNDLSFKLNLIEKILVSASSQDNLEIKETNETVLNSLQLINFINFYFDQDENESQLDLDLNGQDMNEEKEICDKSMSNLISICFPCIACSTKFTFEQTFHLHLDRRSILIRLYCLECKQFKTFFNKCKLFYHIYSHKTSLFEPIYKQINIDQIPIEKCFSQSSSKHLENLNMIFSNLDSLTANDLENNPNSNLNLIINHRFKLNDQDLMQIKIFLRRFLMNKFLVYKCFICDAIFFDLKELKVHFLASKKFDSQFCTNNNSNQSSKLNFKMLKENYLNSRLSQFDSNSDLDLLNNFSYKKLQFSTKCAQLAKINLIKQKFKFSSYLSSQQVQHQQPGDVNGLICPECGLIFHSKLNKNYMSLFRLHLKYDCLFTIKYDLDEIKCPFTHCNFASESTQAMVNHWCASHLIKQHKCNICIKNGVNYLFNETGQQNEHHDLVNQEKNLASVGDDCLYKDILYNKNEKNDSNNLSINLIGEINKHYFEKHRGEQISLKLNYKCMCKKYSKLSQLENERAQVNTEDNSILDDLNNSCEKEYSFKDWKFCKRHILDQINKSISSIECFICNKFVSNKNYLLHMKQRHSNEHFFTCPQCGPIKNEPSLHCHILRFHSQLNLNKYESGCYFNLIISNQSKSVTQQNSANSEVQRDENTLFRSLIEKSSQTKDLNIYLCLNCRLFFTNDTKFSHNCWNTSTNSKAENEKPSNGSEPIQPISNQNYFSPIYLKFNVSKLLVNNSKAMLSLTQSLVESKVSSSSVSNESDDIIIDVENESSQENPINQANKKFKFEHSVSSRSDLSLI